MYSKFAVATLALLFSSIGVSAQETVSQSTTVATSQSGWNASDWNLEDSEFEPEEGWHFGQLDNGLRYVIRPNERPEGTALVRMYIATGSLDETEEERGFAHFVEHMAFNGSTNVPEGEMVKLLEREGLAFGADTNASTGFDQTQYKLDLPRADSELLDTALMLMRETVSELTFDPAAVERERGVILSERRSRNNYSFKNTLDSFDFLYPEGRISTRIPIGTVDTLNAATAAGLRAFWEREYLPSDTVVVVVGDFTVEEAEERIIRHFADWQRSGTSKKVDAGTIDPMRTGETDIYVDPALTETLTLARHGSFIDRPDTLDERHKALLRSIGARILNRRLQTLVRSEDAPFRGVQIGVSDFFEAGRTAELSVASEDGQWRPAIMAAVREYRTALQYGFSEAEVAEQMANLRTAYENAERNAATRRNAAFLRDVELIVEGDRVPAGPTVNLANFERFAAGVTPEAVLAAFREDAIPLDEPLIRFAGKSAPEGGEAELREAVQSAFAQPISPYDQSEQQNFAYTDFGPSGEVIEDRRIESIGARAITFANRVRLNLKPTDLADNNVLISVAIDGGQALETRDNPNAVALASLLPAGGLGEHSRDELQSILAGRAVRAAFSAGDDAFQASASTTPDDLELQLQLLTAYIVDPGYRAEGLGPWRKSLPDFYAKLGKTPASALNEARYPLLTDNDPRFVRQPIEEYSQLDYDQLSRNISDRLQNGAIEIGVVGDIDEARVIELVSRTFGALPQRETDWRDYDDGRRQLPFTTDRGVHVVTHEGEADQAMVRLIWPTVDDDDWREVSALNLLARVVQLELTEKLREELGQTYSASVSSSPSSRFDDFGTFEMGVSVDVDQVSAARAAMGEVLRRLRKQPVSDDVLQRARQPVLQSLDNRFKSNSGWLQVVARAQSQPKEVERILQARTRYESYTAEDLQELAMRFLDPAGAVDIRVLPRDAPEAATER
ncbi:insulinase family protein [Altererythrobacter aurantiacus]|uniref:Insulinase family protein n=1 Tax=Parapontixanthobacter aurantiacus TaxID=1463599 RepID=A0A844ZCT6_9SPHN|nr:insulinase family protein [Parapontixanthobacter aurantiacus]MXO84817.1 insulinase family protein [Parapontixanthobacter aurantiacus]